MKFQKSSLIIISVILFVFTGTVFSQATDRNYLGISFGGSDFHVLDKQASPLIFNSIGIAPSLQFMYNGENSSHYAEASYYPDNLGTSVNNFSIKSRRGRLRYAYLHSVTNFEFWGNKIKFYLGGSINSYLCHSDYNYYSQPTDRNDFAYTSWYWSSSLDLCARLEYYPSGREFFSFQFFVPVVSNISRPKYSPSGDVNYSDNDRKFKMFGDTKFISDNFSVNALLIYQRPIFGQFNLQLSYEFYYSSYNIPRNVNMYMNNLRAGLFFCF